MGLLYMSQSQIKNVLKVVYTEKFANILLLSPK